MILAVIEHSDGRLLPAAFNVATAAHAAVSAGEGKRIVALLLGKQGENFPVSEALALGFDEVIQASSEHLRPYRAMTFAQAIVEVSIASKPSMIVMASTSVGKESLPCAAYMLDAATGSDVVEFLGHGKVLRAMYAGNVLAEVELTGAIKAVTIRPSAFDSYASGGTESGKGSATLSEVVLSTLTQPTITVESVESVSSARPQLSSARAVVSGGRAFKTKEEFEKIVFPLADRLGAAVGASRAVVDAGIAPNDWQVGQTGKIVAPDLYVALGLSGAIQHVAGMKDSKVVVAVNADRDAPIFQVCDYGIVGDVFEVAPKLLSLLEKE